MRYIQCDMCGVKHEEKQIDKASINSVTLTRPEQHDIKKDLCNKCYRGIVTAIKEIYPKEGIS